MWIEFNNYQEQFEEQVSCLLCRHESLEPHVAPPLSVWAGDSVVT